MGYTSGGKKVGPTKVCPDCGQEYPLTGEYFHLGRKKKDGFQNKCKVCAIEASTKWNRENKEQRNETRLKWKYGITQNDYDKMIRDQHYKCKICGTHQVDLKVALAIDHCHRTGIIRGLLCTKCNVALGLFNEKIEMLQRAIRYLQTAWRKY